jgi:hypothetical protein
MALECMRLARHAADAKARTVFVMMAERWFNFAIGPCHQGTFDAALREFNEGQMMPKQQDYSGDTEE